MPARLTLVSATLASLSLLLSACSVDEIETSAADHAAGVAAGDVTPGAVTPGDDPITWTQLVPGSQCVAHADCDSAPSAGDGFCYRGDMGGSLVFPPEGYCTIDDGSGAVCATNADCPATSQCISAEGYRLCLPACGPSGECPAGQACFTTFGGLPINAPSCLPGNAAAVDGAACSGFYNCNDSSICWNDFENPGGYCTAYACNVATNAGCNGGACIDFREGPSTGTVCVETCALDTHCRAGYVCRDPDGAGSAPRYCRAPHAGDACASAADCGGGDWLCLVTGFPGGYCTQMGCPTVGSTDGCSSGSICGDVGGLNMCLDRCATIGTTDRCRDGYTCGAVGAANGGACVVPG